MRKRRLLIIFLTFLVLLSASGLALDHIYPAKVERVVDGDTIVADLQLGLGVVLAGQYIRFYGIHAWEITGEEREKGLISRDYLVERLSSGEIEIEIRPEWGQTGKGSFGRWIGIVYVDGADINVEMMEKGHAVKYEEGED